MWNWQSVYEWVCVRISYIFCYDDDDDDDDLCICSSTFAVVVVAFFNSFPISLQGKADKHYQLFIFLYIITAFVLIATSYLPLIKVLSNPNDQSPAFTTA